jgi:aryl-alcohol dehydrogenase-like predicted oxidoreductase
VRPFDLITRPVPSTGEEIPVVGIGTARRYDVAASGADIEPLRETLATFRKLGGTLVDTAPSYGNAEVVVGDLVSELGFRDDLFIATKVRKEGRDEGNAEIASSFERLQTDRFDLLQVHNLVGIDTQLPTLRELKDAGRVRYIGMSTSSGRQYEAFADVMRREDMDFIQVNYSLASRDAADVILPLAADRGMAVLVNVPFGRGRLFDAVGERPLPDWAGEFDCESWGQFFLKYIVGHPAVTCVIPGTAKPHYATDNMGAAMGRLPDAAMRAKMEEFFDSLT